MANNKVRIVHRSAGYLELMKSPEVQQELLRRAHDYADACGEGYEVEAAAYVGQTRANVRVAAATDAAKNDNYDNNTMLIGLGGKK